MIAWKIGDVTTTIVSMASSFSNLNDYTKNSNKNYYEAGRSIGEIAKDVKYIAKQVGGSLLIETDEIDIKKSGEKN